MNSKKTHLRQFFRSFNLENVKINSQGPSVELSFKPEDKNAAWELYVEMLTRITTQALPSKKGDEQAALRSVYSLFLLLVKFCVGVDERL